MSLDSTIKLANELSQIRDMIASLQSEKADFQAKIDAINTRLVVLRADKDRKTLDLKTAAEGL